MKLTKKELFDISNTNDLPFEFKENKVTVKDKVLDIIKGTDIELSRAMIRAAYYRTYTEEISDKTAGRVLSQLYRDGDMIRVDRGKYKFNGE